MLLAPDLSFGSRTAIVEPGRGEVTYAELDALVTATADRLARAGVRRGDRVGLYARRSVDVVAAMLATLRVGAAYVPVDPSAPSARNAGIHADCGVRLTLIEERYLEPYRGALAALGSAHVATASIGSAGLGAGLRSWLARDLDTLAPAPATPSGPPDLAYILYTSGSTGRPKGVSITHENAAVFVAWCHAVLRPTVDDRFANHAQFHFDVSVLDVYTSLTSGAALVLVPDEVGKHAASAAALLAAERITVWYSAPSILAQMAGLGTLPDLDLSALRVIAFAGEVFPIDALKRLKAQVPRPRYLNLYGPTETNVCTFYELPRTFDDATRPFPIGLPCAHYVAKVVDPEGRAVARGVEGELLVRGPGVMAGYWGRPDLTAERTISPEDDGPAWYRTGDIVTELPDGNLVYVGRRDRMIKLRGYRVELGEIEVRLHEHPQIDEAAVVVDASDDGPSLHAHVATRNGTRLSLLQLKAFCGERLPAYMIPEKFHFHASLPRTSTDKVDYPRLRGLV